MMFTAAGVQAETGARWLVLKTLGGGGGVMSETELNAGGVTLELQTDTATVLHTKIAGIAVLFECQKVQMLKGVLKAEGKVATGMQVKFGECITKLNGATSSACKPFVGVESGGIITTRLHGLIELVTLEVVGTKDDGLKVLPDNVVNKEGKEVASETLANIEMGEECSIGEKVPVIGKVTLKDCFGNLGFLTHQLEHLVEVGPRTELWTISKTAEHVATLLGSSLVGLGIDGTGFNHFWSGDPA